MSGCITVPDDMVDELIEFHADAPGVARGYVMAQCTACDAYTTGDESSVKDWAYAHVDSRHTRRRHAKRFEVTGRAPDVQGAYFIPGTGHHFGLASNEGKGRHRALVDHAFVQHRGDDRHGCGFSAEGEPDVRCGFYRQHHPTMAVNR